MAAGDVTILADEVFGTLSCIIGTMELPAGAYTAGGYALSPAKFGLTTVLFVDIEPVEVAADHSTALFGKYNHAGDKIGLYETSGTVSTEMDSSNADVSNNVTDLRFKAYGRK